jgi:hypothetical protein
MAQITQISKKKIKVVAVVGRISEVPSTEMCRTKMADGASLIRPTMFIGDGGRGHSLWLLIYFLSILFICVICVICG